MVLQRQHGAPADGKQLVILKFATSCTPAQAQGEWTEEEHTIFLETARAHGVGDKWGLFASYLPQVELYSVAKASLCCMGQACCNPLGRMGCRCVGRRCSAAGCRTMRMCEVSRVSALLHYHPRPTNKLQTVFPPCPLQRVGYQCSAYYRDVIIPQGLVIDRRFKMTRNGRAVYVG